MNTILVTGGLGYIGSHCSLELLKQGQNILIIDSLINSSIEVKSKIELLLNKKKIKKKGLLFFRKGDLRNKEWLKRTFEEFKVSDNKISSVIHLAGLKSVEESTKFPLEYWDVNLKGTLNLLNVMAENNCFNIIFSSSAMIYKQNSEKPFKEDSEKSPTNTYANTKFSIEKILEDLYKSEPLKWRIANLRYFNPVGAHESGLIGENPKVKASNLFPAIIKSLEKNGDELLVFGKDWPTKDGTCVRDYIHIKDICRAIDKSIEYLFNNKNNYEIINIGSSTKKTNFEILNAIQKVTGIDNKYKVVKRRKGDVDFLTCSVVKARQKLQWMPVYSNIKNIINDEIKWVKYLLQNKKFRKFKNYL